MGTAWAASPWRGRPAGGRPGPGSGAGGVGRGRYPTSRPEGDPRAEQRFNEIRPGPSARSLLLRLPFLLLLFHLGLLHLAWRAFVPFRGGSVRLWAEGTEGDSEGSAAETTARDSPAPGAPACGEPYLCFHVGVAGAAAGVRGAAVTAALLVGGGAVRPGPLTRPPPPSWKPRGSAGPWIPRPTSPAPGRNVPGPEGTYPHFISGPRL